MVVPNCDRGRSWDEGKQSCECPEGEIFFPEDNSEFKECFGCNTADGHVACIEREGKKREQWLPILLGSLFGVATIMTLTTFRAPIYAAATGLYRRVFPQAQVQIIPLNGLVPVLDIRAPAAV
jgi:hypothetical protein